MTGSRWIFVSGVLGALGVLIGAVVGAAVERDLAAMQAQSRGPTTLRLSNAATCQAAVDLDIMAE